MMNKIYSKQDFRKFCQSRNPFGMSAIDAQLASIEAHGGGYINPTILEEREFNMSQMDVFSRLMMDRIIFLGTDVSSYSANIVNAQLLYLDSVDPERDINMYINSPGGSCIDGFAVIDTMDFIKADVSTLCAGLAASFGAMLLCNGAKGKRSALPHASIMIHQPLISGGISGQATDIEIENREMQKTKKALYEVMAANTGRSFQEVWDACERNNWMTSEEAKDFGLIDTVIQPKK